MNQGNEHIKEILESIEAGRLSAEEGYARLKLAPFEDLGYAKVDHHRVVRQGAAEVIYGASKTREQIEGIVNSLLMHSPENILITRLSPESAEYLSTRFTLFYDNLSKIGIVNRTEHITAKGTIVVATGGTSDIPVAEEAALTAEALGNHVERLYDVGVAGAAPPTLQSSCHRRSKCHHRCRRHGRVPWQVSSAVSAIVRLSAFPPASATVQAFRGYPRFCPCSTPVLAESLS